MMPVVVLVVGTPCVGKSTLSRRLVECLGGFYVNLTDYANQNGLTLGEDSVRNTVVVDEEKMCRALLDTISQSVCSVVVVDGHFAASVVSCDLSSFVFVLRRNPVELKGYMQKEGFSENKMFENLSAEILDVCLVEALEVHGDKVCEIDVTGKTVDQTLAEVLSIISQEKPCSRYGVVDWLGFLEQAGLTDRYLRG